MTIGRVIGGFATLAVIVGCIVGCGDSAAKVATEPVSGTVTLNGAPVAGATVSFSPKTQGNPAAFGTTDASGAFTMTTVAPGDGAMAGSYGVTVTKSSQPAGGGAAAAGSDTDSSEDAMEAAYAEHEASKTGGGESGPQDLLPAKYKDAATSGLTAEVPSGGVSDLEFKLTQ